MFEFKRVISVIVLISLIFSCFSATALEDTNVNLQVKSADPYEITDPIKTPEEWMKYIEKANENSTKAELSHDSIQKVLKEKRFFGLE